MAAFLPTMGWAEVRLTALQGGEQKRGEAHYGS